MTLAYFQFLLEEQNFAQILYTVLTISAVNVSSLNILYGRHQTPLLL